MDRPGEIAGPVRLPGSVPGRVLQPPASRAQSGTTEAVSTGNGAWGVADEERFDSPAGEERAR